MAEDSFNLQPKANKEDCTALAIHLDDFAESLKERPVSLLYERTGHTLKMSISSKSSVTAPSPSNFKRTHHLILAIVTPTQNVRWKVVHDESHSEALNNKANTTRYHSLPPTKLYTSAKNQLVLSANHNGIDTNVITNTNPNKPYGPNTNSQVLLKKMTQKTIIKYHSSFIDLCT